MFAPINRNPDARTLRQFGWIMLGGMTFLGVLLWGLKVPVEARWTWAGHPAQWTTVAFWIVGAAIACACRLSAGAARTLYVGWMTATRPIGIAMFVVGLSLMFFVVLPLFALILRMSDPMRRRLRRVDSYWEPVRPYEATPQRMARPF